MSIYKLNAAIFASLISISSLGCHSPVQLGEYAVTGESLNYDPQTKRHRIVLNGTDDPFGNNARRLELMTIDIEAFDGPVIDQGIESKHEGRVSTVGHWWQTSNVRYSFLLKWDRVANDIECGDSSFSFIEGMNLRVEFPSSGSERVGQFVADESNGQI